MIKKIAAVLLYGFSYAALACSDAVPTNDPSFCSSFKSVAACYCTTSGVPGAMCQNMTFLYSSMIARFGTLEKACQYQQDYLHYTTAQNCMDNWNCYLKGGIDSRGRQCSSTKLACQ